VSLDTWQTRKYLLERWKEDPGMCALIKHSFDIVNCNKDIPVLDFRLGGVVERVGYLGSDMCKLGRRTCAAVANAARLMADEIEMAPWSYAKYVSLSDRMDRYNGHLKGWHQTAYWKKSTFTPWIIDGDWEK
jgi:hypothetical protein